MVFGLYKPLKNENAKELGQIINKIREMTYSYWLYQKYQYQQVVLLNLQDLLLSGKQVYLI